MCNSPREGFVPSRKNAYRWLLYCSGGEREPRKRLDLDKRHIITPYYMNMTHQIISSPLSPLSSLTASCLTFSVKKVTRRSSARDLALATRSLLSDSGELFSERQEGWSSFLKKQKEKPRCASDWSFKGAILCVCAPIFSLTQLNCAKPTKKQPIDFQKTSILKCSESLSRTTSVGSWVDQLAQCCLLLYWQFGKIPNIVASLFRSSLSL